MVGPCFPLVSPRRRALTALVFVGLVSGAGAQARGRRAPAKTYEELRDRLPGASDVDAGSKVTDKVMRRRAKMLARFAKDQRVALSDRLIATSAWRRSLDSDSLARVEADLLEAHLRAVGQSPSLRKKALRRALRQAKRIGRSVERKAAAADRSHERVKTILEGDAAYEKLTRSIAKRRRELDRSPPSSLEAKWATKIEAALKTGAHKQAGDLRRRAELQLALALLLEVTEAKRRDVDRALTRLVRVGGTRRDLAVVRQQVRQARARVLAEEGDWKQAIHEALVADRAVKVPSHLSSFGAPSAKGSKTPTKANAQAAAAAASTRYTKSRATAELCFAAGQRGLRCSDLERTRMGALSFYDYSTESTGSFDELRAAMAFREYEPLLQGCLHEAATASHQLDETRVELEWTIAHDGKVSRFSMRPRRLRGTPLETCVKGAFDTFRYPRYRGELQHTQLAFDVDG